LIKIMTATPEGSDTSPRLQRTASARRREPYQDVHLDNALRKRAAGVPTLSVAEAASLLSISTMLLYRLIKADAFPAVRFAGRYLIPTRAIDTTLETATSSGGVVDAAAFTQSSGPPADLSQR
jgi:excisionase family DNA binding protein